MRYAYIRADKLSDINVFESKANADKIFCDMLSLSGYSNNIELGDLLESLKPGDTLVIKSLSELSRGIQGKEFLGTVDLHFVLKTCISKTVEIESLEDKKEYIQLLLRPDGYKAFCIFEEIFTARINKDLNADVKPGKQTIDYPERFYKNYKVYIEGLKDRKNKDRLTGDKVAENLGISRRSFLKYRRDFER